MNTAVWTGRTTLSVGFHSIRKVHRSGHGEEEQGVLNKCPNERPREPVRVWVCGNSTFAPSAPLHDASTFVFSASSGISICLTKQNDGAQCGGGVRRVCSFGVRSFVRSLLNSCARAFSFIRRFQNPPSFRGLLSHPFLLQSSFPDPHA